MRELPSTASGFTQLNRIPAAPPSSARQRARCNSAALAELYAAPSALAIKAFFELMNTTLPPCDITRNDSLPARK